MRLNISPDRAARKIDRGIVRSGNLAGGRRPSAIGNCRKETAVDQSAEGKIAVVTGATRGMGFDTCRQLARRGARVVLTGRDGARAGRQPSCCAP